VDFIAAEFNPRVGAHGLPVGRSSLLPDSRIRKVLIYRLGSLGDTVVALPCFHLIERVFPQSERVLLTNFPVHAKAPPAAAVLGDSGLVHGYMRYTAGTRSVGELLRLAWQIRRFAPDVLVYLMPARAPQQVRRDRWFFRLAGMRRIVGLPGDGELKHHFDAATGLYEAEASRLARAVATLGDAHPDDLANWDPRLAATELQTAARALAPLAGRPLLACAPGCKMQANDWEQENWRALLRRLYKTYPSFGLVMAGAKEDAATCEYAAMDWGGAKVNLAGTLSPRESAAVFSHTRAFLGTDSGPKHLAACMGVPCVCVFSARDLPGVWFPPGKRNQIVYHQPECSGCGLETCIVMKKKCILSITVDEMEQALDRVLTQWIEV
jgi:ADP-heptose:LPS heptosyltransferase